MATFQKTAAPKQTLGDSTAGPSSSSSSHPFRPYHHPSAASSTDTVIHHPQDRKENVRPTPSPALYRTKTNEPPGLRTIRVETGIPYVIGFPTRITSATDFDLSITQKPNWELPRSIRDVLDHQAKKYAEPKPKEASYEVQARKKNRCFDPDYGTIYSSCTECDDSGGPTDCQHPEDPKEYSTRLNPIRPNDPGFAHLNDPFSFPTTPRKPSPGDKLISKVSPSKASITPKSKIRLILSYPGGVEKAVEYLRGFSHLNHSKDKQFEHPDEMLAARYLSNFLTENVEEGVATSYIIFTTHGTLLGYSSPLEVKTARNVAALAGITWRANDQALLRGGEVKPLTSGATLLKTVTITKAERHPGLFNMICVYKDLLMAVQWIKGGFLAAAMIEATGTDHIYDADKYELAKEGLTMGAGTDGHDDGVWEDEGAVEETSEDEEDKAKARKDPAKQAKLFAKSQGLAEAIRMQWNADDFKMPRGFR